MGDSRWRCVRCGAIDPAIRVVLRPAEGDEGALFFHGISPESKTGVHYRNDEAYEEIRQRNRRDFAGPEPTIAREPASTLQISIDYACGPVFCEWIDAPEESDEYIGETLRAAVHRRLSATLPPEVAERAYWAVEKMLSMSWYDEVYHRYRRALSDALNMVRSTREDYERAQSVSGWITTARENAARRGERVEEHARLFYAKDDAPTAHGMPTKLFMSFPTPRPKTTKDEP